MLDHSREKAFGSDLDLLPFPIERINTQLAPPWHTPTKIGNAQATLPIFDQLVVEDSHLRIHKDSHRDGATRPVAFDDGNRKGFVNLRGGEADAVILHHGFEHVVPKLLSACPGQALRGYTPGFHSEHRMSKVADLQDGHLIRYDSLDKAFYCKGV